MKFARSRPRRRLLATLGAALVCLTLALPAAADVNLAAGDAGRVAYTNGDGVNVRLEPGFGAGVVSTLDEGVRVRVVDGPLATDDGSDWYHVTAPDADVDGWVNADYLAAADGVDAGAGGTPATVLGTGGYGLRLRDGATTGATTIAVLPEGAAVTLTELGIEDADGRSWAAVSFEDLHGFSLSSYLEPSAAADDAAAVADAGATPATEEPAAAPQLAVGGRAAVVNTDGAGLNLRYEAGYDAGVMTVMPEGVVVTILDGPAGDGWHQVDYAGTSGWANGAYLAATDAAAADPAPATTESAPADAQPVSETPNEQPPSDAQPPAEEPEPVAAPTSGVGAAIVAEALNYVGVPYVWGGTTPSGFDCSGFTYYVVNRAGIGLSRDMTEQVISGAYANEGDLAPGDLVFFQNTYKWGLSHVGIYIGGGQFVHAGSERTGVTISNLSDSYWAPRYYTARRIG